MIESVCSDDALPAREGKCWTLLDSIDEGFCIIEVLFDTDGAPNDYRFLAANAAFEVQSGMRDVIGRRMREMEPRHEEHWFDAYGRVALTGEPERLTRPAKYLGDRWFDFYAFRVSEPGARTVGVLFRDISARVQAEAALHESEQRLQHSLTTARIAYWVWDPASDMTEASASLGDLFGLPAGERYPDCARAFEVMHPEDRDRHRSVVDGAVARGDGWRAEFRIVRPSDGSTLWLEEAVTVESDAKGRPRFAGFVRDVTDRKAAEVLAERARAKRGRDGLRRRFIAAEEEERRRLSRELHDEAGQHLTALTLGLRALAEVAPPNSEVDLRVEKLSAIADTLAEELHRVAVHLRPKALDDFGLQAALTAYVADWARWTGVDVDVYTTLDGGGLTPEIESVVYRIVQEALTNVVRHSGASRAGLVVKQQNGHLAVIIEDDGWGFDVEQFENELGETSKLGLRGMRERAELLGGSLEIESTPGLGTAVFARIPMADAGSSAEEAREGNSSER